MQIPRFPVHFVLNARACYPGEWLSFTVLAEAICAQVSVVICAAAVPAGKKKRLQSEKNLKSYQMHGNLVSHTSLSVSSNIQIEQSGFSVGHFTPFHIKHFYLLVPGR